MDQPNDEDFDRLVSRVTESLKSELNKLAGGKLSWPHYEQLDAQITKLGQMLKSLVEAGLAKQQEIDKLTEELTMARHDAEYWHQMYLNDGEGFPATEEVKYADSK